MNLPQTLSRPQTGVLARGRLSLLAAEPGPARDRIVVDLVANVTRAEDDALFVTNAEPDEVHRQMAAAGADPSRIAVLRPGLDSACRDGDLEVALRGLRSPKLAVVVARDYLAGVAARYIPRELSDLATVARRLNVAVLLVADPAEVSEDVARTAVAILTAEDAPAPSDPAEAPSPTAEPTAVEDAAAPTAEAPSDPATSDPPTVEAPPATAPAKLAAADWLRERLSAGPRAVVELRTSATAAGICWRSIEAAKAALGVLARRKGFGPGSRWGWALPVETKTAAVSLSAEPVAAFA